MGGGGSWGLVRLWLAAEWRISFNQKSYFKNQESHIKKEDEEASVLSEWKGGW
jgi:hypothetical protein